MSPKGNSVDLLIFCDWAGAEWLNVYRIRLKPEPEIPCMKCIGVVDTPYGKLEKVRGRMKFKGDAYVCDNCGAVKPLDEALFEKAEIIISCSWPDYLEHVEAYSLEETGYWRNGKYVEPEPRCEEIVIGPRKLKIIAFAMLSRFNPKPILATERSRKGLPYFRLAFKVAAPREVWETLKTLERFRGKLTSKEMEKILKEPTPERIKSILGVKALLQPT